MCIYTMSIRSIYLVSDLEGSDKDYPITGLFIDDRCNSRSSHCQVRTSSTEQLRLEQNCGDHFYICYDYQYILLPTQNGLQRRPLTSSCASTRPINSPHEPHGPASVSKGLTSLMFTLAESGCGVGCLVHSA